MDFEKPFGWECPDPKTVSYEFGEARYGDGPADIPANEIGSGEDDYHSRYVSPDSPHGAAKVSGGKGSYGNNDEYKPEKSEKDPGNVGSIDLPIGHIVLEDGIVQGRTYYLVQDLKTGKMYTVVPDLKPGETYKSGMKGDRTSALQEAYRVLSATLPDSALAQLRERFPESLAL
jgi:hypothetical protein